MSVVLHVKRPGMARMQSVDIDTSQLPPQLRMLIRNLGFQYAVKLIQALGGTSLYVPQAVRPEHTTHRAWEILGEEGFRRLVLHYGNTNVTLPKADSLVRQARHQYVLSLLSRGIPVREIALASGYCVRSIELIHAKHTPVDVQGDLFHEK